MTEPGRRSRLCFLLLAIVARSHAAPTRAYEVYGEHDGACNFPHAEFSDDQTPAGFDGYGRCEVNDTADACAEACEQTAGCEFFSHTPMVPFCCFLHRTCEEPNRVHPRAHHTAYRWVATSTTETITETSTTSSSSTPETITELSTTSSSTQARPDGVCPGDAVEVKCEPENAYHLAAVHNVSRASIVVIYEFKGHLYYCTPKVWRTVVANKEEVCEPHGGILPAWGGDKCCPTSCGECGTTDCHTKPGGRDSCCTHHIPNHYVCGKDGRTAPCTLVQTLPFEEGRRLRGDVGVAIARILRDLSL